MRNFLRQTVARGYGTVSNLGKAFALICFGIVPASNFPASASTIAAFGDSLVHGYGLAHGQGFVPQLEDWLRRAGRDTIVINAGVSGDTSAGGLSRIGWTLTPEVDGLIVVFGGNDFLRGIPPQASRSNLDGILKFASGRNIRVLLVGHEVPENFGPAYKADFEAIYPELAEKYGTLLFEKIFDPLDAMGDRDLVRRDFMQDDGMHPNSDGVRLIVESMGPVVLELIELIEEGS